MKTCLHNVIRAALHALVLRPFVRLLCGVHVVGSHHLRRLNQFVVIANHNSHLDVFLLFYLLALRDVPVTRPVAEETYFARLRIVQALVRFLFDPVWIRRGDLDRCRDPLAGLKDLLNSGCNLIIFPEGTRGRPGELLPFKSGIGRLVSHYPDIPIVPIFLSGPERVLPKGCTLPLPFWTHILIGPPQVCTGSHRKITRQLQDALIELSQSDAAQRHQRRRKRQRPAPAIAVLGIDGSGKSTMSRRAAQQLSARRSACLVSDQLEFYERGGLKPLQPLGVETIRGIIGRYAKRAPSLKSYKIPKLAELMLRDRLYGEVNRWYAPDVIVQDGSPLLNMSAWTALYGVDTIDDETLAIAISVMAGETRSGPDRYAVFEKLPELRYFDRLGLAHMKLPRYLILLDLPAKEACCRIATRGDERQPHETEEKLGKLRDAYLRVCRIVDRYWNIPTLVIDATRPLDDASNEAMRFLTNVMKQEAQ
jgi:1-acyl-sn-glycerol-3-phosphate acyltransferase